jgi:hypothetical protein
MKNDLVCQLNFYHKIWGAVSVMMEGDAAYLRRLNNSRERHVRERTAQPTRLDCSEVFVFDLLSITTI